MYWLLTLCEIILNQITFLPTLSKISKWHRNLSVRTKANAKCLTELCLRSYVSPDKPKPILAPVNKSQASEPPSNKELCKQARIK